MLPPVLIVLNCRECHGLLFTASASDVRSSRTIYRERETKRQCHSTVLAVAMTFSLLQWSFFKGAIASSSPAQRLRQVQKRIKASRSN